MRFYHNVVTTINIQTSQLIEPCQVLETIRNVLITRRQAVLPIEQVPVAATVARASSIVHTQHSDASTREVLVA